MEPPPNMSSNEPGFQTLSSVSSVQYSHFKSKRILEGNVLYHFENV